MTTVETDHGQAELAKLAPQPGRGGTTLKAEALKTGSVLGEVLGDHLRIGGCRALEYDPPGVIDNADGCLLQGHIETSIGLSCFIDRALRHGVPSRPNHWNGQVSTSGCP